jgi:hypothetical protein
MTGAAASFALARRAAGNAWLGLGGRWTRAEIAGLVANIALACAIVWTFHASFWWPPDDGAYAYIADRLRNGDVLNRDLHDVHAGYVHFLHALAFDLFGRDLLSLRYPLALLTVAQSAIVFLLLRPLIGPFAICGGLAMSALTLVQFLNPTANWYALFLTVIVIALLAARAERTTFGLIAIGFVLAALFLFRQLTGVFVGMGAVAYLLLPEPGAAARSRGRPVLAWFIAGSMAMVLAAYLWLKTDATAFALYGIWPLAMLLVIATRTRLDDGAALQLIAAPLAGAALAAVPLLLYHSTHGSLGPWWEDTFASAVALTDLEFFRQASYATLLSLAVKGLASTSDPVAAINGVFWILTTGASAALGIAVLRALLQDEKIHPLPLIALFHALVSAHYAIPIYALFSIGLTLAGWLALARQPLSRVAAIAATLFAVSVGLAFQAAQPLSRGLNGIIRGERVALGAAGLPGATLRIEREDRARYARLLSFIEEHADPRQPILGLPMTPELYFLSNRKPPVRFAIAPLGLRSDRELQQTWSELEAGMPAVVVFKPDDKYTTPRVRELMRRLQSHYRLCRTIGGFELYARACRT